MWKDVDFSKIHIDFDLDDLHVTVLNANRTAFFESFPNHLHSFYELHYIFGGTGRLICDGQSYPLSAGMLYLNGRSVSHEQITDPEDPMMEYSISFDIRRDSKGKKHFAEKLMDMQLWIGQDTNQIGSLFAEIENELGNRKMGDIHIIRSLFQMIFVKMVRNFHAENSAGFGKNTIDRRKFLMDEAFIYDYRDMSLATLAKTLNLSPRHVIRNIQEYYGMNFTQFRNRSRMSAAARLLVENTLQISEISEKVGFSTTAYFRKIFCETYGISPSEYRKKHSRKQKKTPQPK